MIPATISRRLAAIAYDSLLFTAIMIVASMILTAVLNGVFDQDFRSLSAIGKIFFYLYYGLVFTGTQSWFWVKGNQTLGMRAWNIRLVSVSGKPISWTQAFTRSLLICFSLGLGIITLFFDPKNQSLYDRLTKTQTIMTDKDFVPGNQDP